VWVLSGATRIFLDYTLDFTNNRVDSRVRISTEIWQKYSPNFAQKSWLDELCIKPGFFVAKKWGNFIKFGLILGLMSYTYPSVGFEVKVFFFTLLEISRLHQHKLAICKHKGRLP